MNYNNIIKLRMLRQHLQEPVNTKEEYDELVSLMQPITPLYFSRPGDPPRLVHRASFDDSIRTDILRGNRELIKARFQGGTVGYVFAKDMELYICAYKKPIENLTFKQKYILEAITHTGPLTCQQIKEESGILIKEITPVLHRLQEAFLVYEDQTDSEWDRGWYDFSNEWYEIDINKYSRTEALAELIIRFLDVMVFATLENMKGWFRLTLKDIKEAIKYLEAENKLLQLNIDGINGWINKKDFDVLNANIEYELKPSVFMLHKADILVKAFESDLKERYKGMEVLQYILIDGEFKGAVLGHWRIGPHDVEDIIIDLPEKAKLARKAEIIAAVSKFYTPPFSNILKYDGKPL